MEKMWNPTTKKLWSPRRSTGSRQTCATGHPTKISPDSYQSGDIVRATLEIALDKRPWNEAQAVFPYAMCEGAAPPRETIDVKWVSTGIRVSVNSAPSGALPVLSQLASITIGATWFLNRQSSTVLLPVLVSVCCKPFWMMRDARRHVLQLRSSLDRGSFVRLISILKMVTAAVSGWTTCDSNTVF